MNLRSVGYTTAGTLRAPWRLVLFIGVASLVGGAAMLVAMPFAESSRVGSLRAETLSSIIDAVSILCGLWVALRYQDRKPWREVGLDRAAARPRLIAAGFLIGGGAIALAIAFLILTGWLRSTPVRIEPLGHPLIRITVLLLPAALTEEVMTRGYLLTVLRDVWNWPVAVAISSIAFGLLHASNPGANAQSIVLVTLAGVFLATVRIATGSLYAAWAAHFAWNWVMAAIFHVSVSGYAFEVPAYRYVDAGPDWATGGPWGPEGGIPAGLAMIGGTGILLLRLRRRGEGKG